MVRLWKGIGLEVGVGFDIQQLREFEDFDGMGVKVLDFGYMDSDGGGFGDFWLFGFRLLWVWLKRVWINWDLEF